jgi:hypothetical protein
MWGLMKASTVPFERVNSGYVVSAGDSILPLQEKAESGRGRDGISMQQPVQTLQTEIQITSNLQTEDQVERFIPDKKKLMKPLRNSCKFKLAFRRKLS